MRDADARFEQERQRMLAEGPALAPDPHVIVPKSESAFYSKACVKKNTGDAVYVPTWCAYRRNTDMLYMQSGSLTSYDRVYAWNETAFDATLAVLVWWSTRPDYFPRVVPAGTWQWSS